MIARRIAVFLCLVPATISAQVNGESAIDSAKAGAQPVGPHLDFSGMMFANYQYRGDDGPAQSANKFEIERVYLTFRIPAGDRLGVRVTTDVFQQATSGNDSYYRGWTIRAKFAYLQYNYLNGRDWQASAKIGLLQTAFIEHDEQYWPRFIALSPTDRAAYVSPADAGIANTITLPRKLGQIYATITNGPGYTSREVDRFKDYAARLTVTPWAGNKFSPLHGVALTAWGYKGATASRFVDGGEGQVGSVGSSLARNRWGLHVGNLNPRFTFGAEYASRMEEGEVGANTLSSPREVIDSTGTLWSAYGAVRPFRREGAPHPLSLIGRYDRVNTNTDSGTKYEVAIVGLSWDLSSKVSASLDYQENSPLKGTPVSRSHTWFAHFVARF
jgi:hypothetical protein